MTDQRKARLIHELELLQKSKWGWKDLMDYYGVANEKANLIRRHVVKGGGQAPYDPHKVLAEKVIQLIDGSTVAHEIYKRRIELEGVRPEDEPPEALPASAGKPATEPKGEEPLPDAEETLEDPDDEYPY